MRPCLTKSTRNFERSLPRRRCLSLLAGAAVFAATVSFGTLAQAQAYPSRPIIVIAPGSPGTVVDLLARLMGTHMGKALGQPMVVENLPAASGVPGTEKMVRAPKDGYTIALLSNNHAINPSIFRNMPFDSMRDIAPISVIGVTPLVLVTNPSVPARDVRELAALAKSKPGVLNYGSTGNGSVLQLAGVLLNSEAGVDIKHIPYSAFGQMITDIMGGQLDMAFAGVASVAGHIKTGKLRAIGVSTKVRSSILPDVPTLAETGLPDYSFDGWLAFAAPAGTPKPIVDRLNAEVKAALALKEVQDALANMGVITVGSTPEAATQFFQTELDKHASLIKRSGATPQ